MQIKDFSEQTWKWKTHKFFFAFGYWHWKAFIYEIHTMSEMDTLAKNGYSKGFGVRFTDVLVVYG